VPFQSKEVVAFFMSIRTRDECGCSLAAEVLEQNGTVRFRVSGQSMLPTLWPGDVLTIQSKQLDEVDPGELVLYQRRGRFFVHRLISRLGAANYFVTRGDCMAESDSPLSREQFLGVVTAIGRGETVIVPSQTRSLANRLLAFMLWEIEPLQRLVLRCCNIDSSKKFVLPRLRTLRDGVE
jgi:hypothetical protein